MLWNRLILSEQLYPHLWEIDETANRRLGQMMPKLMQSAGVTEALKASDPMKWVGLMNNLKAQAEDPAYNKLGFNIHNYFFAKALDQVRPGGVVAFVTSRYTMDSQNPSVRKHLAQRADLLGAIRLPNTAFKANAGTEVVSDILFLQRRDRVMDIEPDWVHLGQTEDGYAMTDGFLPAIRIGRNRSPSRKIPMPGAETGTSILS